MAHSHYSLRPLAGVIGALLGLAAASTAANSQDVTTQGAALEMAVPGAEWERRTAFLSEDDLVTITELTGSDVEVENPVVIYYVAVLGGAPVGVAYFDAHLVRTMPEVVMVVVRPNGVVQRVEILKFSEPPEYRAPDGWLVQYGDRSLDDELSLKGGIVAMTGATLTSRAVTGAVRRVLALHHFLKPFGDATTGETP